MSQSNNTTTPATPLKKNCKVCYTESESEAFVAFHSLEYDPDHNVCKSCFNRQVECSISEHLPLACSLCAHRVEGSLPSVLAMCTEVQRKRLERIYLHIAFAAMKDLVYCPRVNCEAVFAILPPPPPAPGLSFAAAASQGRTCRLVQCPACTFPLCAECKGEYHGQVSCMQHKQASRNNASLAQLESWRKANTRKCPGCAVDVEKNDGCNHMLCSQCQLPFCWDCLMPLATHDDDGCVPVADAAVVPPPAPALRGRGGYPFRGSSRAPRQPRGGDLPFLPAPARVSSRGRGGRGGAYRPPQSRTPAPAAAPVTAVAAASSAGPVAVSAAAERKQQKKKERAEQKATPRILIDPKAIRRNVLD